MNAHREIPQQFYRRSFRHDAILSSVCAICGRCIGFSPTEGMLQMLERCHHCAEDHTACEVPVTSSK